MGKEQGSESISRKEINSEKEQKKMGMAQERSARVCCIVLSPQETLPHPPDPSSFTIISKSLLPQKEAGGAFFGGRYTNPFFGIYSFEFWTTKGLEPGYCGFEQCATTFDLTFAIEGAQWRGPPSDKGDTLNVLVSEGKAMGPCWTD